MTEIFNEINDVLQKILNKLVDTEVSGLHPDVIEQLRKFKDPKIQLNKKISLVLVEEFTVLETFMVHMKKLHENLTYITAHYESEVNIYDDIVDLQDLIEKLDVWITTTTDTLLQDVSLNIDIKKFPVNNFTVKLLQKLLHANVSSYNREVTAYVETLKNTMFFCDSKNSLENPTQKFLSTFNLRVGKSFSSKEEIREFLKITKTRDLNTITLKYGGNVIFVDDSKILSGTTDIVVGVTKKIITDTSTLIEVVPETSEVSVNYTGSSKYLFIACYGGKSWHILTPEGGDVYIIDQDYFTGAITDYPNKKIEGYNQCLNSLITEKLKKPLEIKDDVNQKAVMSDKLANLLTKHIYELLEKKFTRNIKDLEKMLVTSTPKILIKSILEEINNDAPEMLLTLSYSSQNLEKNTTLVFMEIWDTDYKKDVAAALDAYDYKNFLRYAETKIKELFEKMLEKIMRKNDNLYTALTIKACLLKFSEY